MFPGGRARRLIQANEVCLYSARGFVCSAFEFYSLCLKRTHLKVIRLHDVSDDSEKLQRQLEALAISPGLWQILENLVRFYSQIPPMSAVRHAGVF